MSSVRRRSVSRTLRYSLHRLFPRHERAVDVAISVALGVWIAVLPTLGIALALTALAAHFARVPKGPALVASFVATPPTLFFFFYPVAYFWVGLPLVMPPRAGVDFLAEIQRLTLLNAAEVVGHLWHDARGHVIAFLIGVLVVATITAGVAFGIAYVVMQRKIERRRLGRLARRAALAAESNSASGA